MKHQIAWLNMKVSEVYYSIQGEGISQGVPAHFIRLTGCNLLCGGQGGRLKKSGQATWWCDTEDVWKKGEEMPFETLEEKLKPLSPVLSGNIHLVWTGGEPVIQAEEIKRFIDYLNRKHPENQIYHELETNGTIESDLYRLMKQINCSPKLRNSGMRKSRRITEAITQLRDYNTWFKFVVSNEGDIGEIQEDYINRFNINPKRVILMPGVDSLKDLPERTKFIYEMAKKYYFRAITRGHILAYDRTTGV